MTHNKSRVVSPIREISLKNKNSKKIKFIDKVKQGVYTEVFKGAEFKKGLYFMTRPILHCVLAWFLSEVCSIRQILVGWPFGNIRPCIQISNWPNHMPMDCVSISISSRRSGEKINIPIVAIIRVYAITTRQSCLLFRSQEQLVLVICGMYNYTGQFSLSWTRLVTSCMWTCYPWQ